MMNARLFEVTVKYTYAETRFIAQDEKELTGRQLQDERKMYVITLNAVMAEAWFRYAWGTYPQVDSIDIKDVTPWEGYRGIEVFLPQRIGGE